MLPLVLAQRKRKNSRSGVVAVKLALVLLSVNEQRMPKVFVNNSRSSTKLT